MVLKSSIRTLASPWQQRSHWGLRLTQDAYFSLLTRIKQLLLVAFCDTLAGIEVNFWADGTGRTDERTDGWTDKRRSQNSYLDSYIPLCPFDEIQLQLSQFFYEPQMLKISLLENHSL